MHQSVDRAIFGVVFLLVHTERIEKHGGQSDSSSTRRLHGRPQYLDKNYAGMLIVWDRMFGTFQPEVSRPHYGLTTPVNTFNIGKLQTREYVAIAQDVHRASRWRDRLGYVFGTPAGRPDAERRLVVEESTEVRT